MSTEHDHTLGHLETSVVILSGLFLELKWRCLHRKAPFQVGSIDPGCPAMFFPTRGPERLRRRSSVNTAR